jgi:hypothetical protein
MYITLSYRSVSALRTKSEPTTCFHVEVMMTRKFHVEPKIALRPRTQVNAMVNHKLSCILPRYNAEK